MSNRREQLILKLDFALSAGPTIVTAETLANEIEALFDEPFKELVVRKECDNYDCVDGHVPFFPDGDPVPCPDCKGEKTITRPITVKELATFIKELLKPCKGTFNGKKSITRNTITFDDGGRLEVLEDGKADTDDEPT